MTIKSLDKKIDLNKIKENEGKNYHWSTVNYENVTLVIRRYRYHLTIFTRVNKAPTKVGREAKIEYGAFTFHTDMEKFEDKHDEMMDKYYDKPFTDLNVIIKDLIKLLMEKDGSVHWVWNSASLKRPDHVEIKLAFAGNDINSLDNFVFCIEELENIFQTLFAENTMLQKLKEYKNRVGEKLNENYIIGKVSTNIKDGYYHGAGIILIDAKDKKEKNFKDVYSLTRYYFDDIFQEKIYFYDGEVYVKGEEFKVGEPVTYKTDYDDTFLFQEKYSKENFIPLVKY